MLLGELAGVLAQIAINVGQSVIGDYDGANSGMEKYAYLKATSGNPGLLADLDVALQLARDSFQCLCNVS
jgi:hypothetical protein